MAKNDFPRKLIIHDPVLVFKHFDWDGLLGELTGIIETPAPIGCNSNCEIEIRRHVSKPGALPVLEVAHGVARAPGWPVEVHSITYESGNLFDAMQSNHMRVRSNASPEIPVDLREEDGEEA